MDINWEKIVLRKQNSYSMQSLHKYLFLVLEMIDQISIFEEHDICTRTLSVNTLYVFFKILIIILIITGVYKAELHRFYEFLFVLLHALLSIYRRNDRGAMLVT